jgi:site-specific DNA-methyltransferase (adenine-specific)
MGRSREAGKYEPEDHQVNPYYDRDGITIYHGDCREILPGISDSSIDLVLTDPPYGHNNNNGDLIHRWEEALGRGTVSDNESRPIANDGPEANDLIRWSFTEWRRILRPGHCCCCCCCGGGPDPQFARWSLWMDEVFDFKQMVVWDKGPMGMGWHYRRSYETVLVGTKPGAKCAWFDETGRVENIIRDIPKIIPSADEHPTPKPVELMCRFIRWHTLPGMLVLDPFCGAGTTLEAAKRMHVRSIGVEIEERYCEAAAKRLEQGILDFGAIK